LKGKGPLIGSACLFTTRPHFFAEDLSLRSVTPGLGAKLSVALTKRVDLVLGCGYGINAPRGHELGGRELDAEFQFKY
jgi:hypothetical protein